MLIQKLKKYITDSQKVNKYWNLSSLVGRRQDKNRTKEILHQNPTVDDPRPESLSVQVSVYDYDATTLEKYNFDNVTDTFVFKGNGRITWINIDGIRKPDIELICNHYDIHPLLQEDILSIEQRPKMDEMNTNLFCLLNMLYYNKQLKTVETEQISLVLCDNLVISFQENPIRDVFDPLRTRLKLPYTKIRNQKADYLFYSMLDLIVDNYFLVMEELSNEIQLIEDEIIKESKKENYLLRINSLRKELMVLKRNIIPVREIIGRIIHNHNNFLDNATIQYFKDINDHIIQAFELSDNYSDMLVNVQDLYISNANIKLNEVMKVIAFVSCLLAPATVIGGIFGMNFDMIPAMHNQWGFYIATGSMLFIPFMMIWIFKKRGWF